MELQFVYNPRKGKTRTGEVSDLANERRRRSLRETKKARKSNGGSMARKKRRKKATVKKVRKQKRKASKPKVSARSKSRRGSVKRRKKNPYTYVKYDGTGPNKYPLTKKDFATGRGQLGIRAKMIKAEKKKGVKAKAGKIASLASESEHLKEFLASSKRDKQALEQWKKEQRKAGTKVYKLTHETGGKSVAKKRKKRKSKGSKKRASMKKRTTKRRASRSKRRGARRSRKIKNKILAKVRPGKRRTSAKISGPKLKKRGSKLRKTIKKGKRRYSVMVKRTNPIFGGGMGKAVEQYAGHDVQEMGYLAGGAILEDIAEKLLARIPIMVQLKTQLGTLGPVAAQASGAIVAGGVAALLHGLAVPRLPMQARKYAEPLLRGIIAASVVKAASSLSSTIAGMIPGMSGVIFHPGMSGVRFTPGMSGVQFTPSMSGAPQMGSYQQGQMGYGNSPQMGYGADFGRYNVADYGGGDGYTENHKYSSANFGACDEDDMVADDEPLLDQSSGMA